MTIRNIVMLAFLAFIATGIIAAQNYGPPYIIRGNSAYLNDTGAFSGNAPYTYQWYSIAPNGMTQSIAGATQLWMYFNTSSATPTGTWQFFLSATDSNSVVANSVTANVVVNSINTSNTSSGIIILPSTAAPQQDYSGIAILLFLVGFAFFFISLLKRFRFVFVYMVMFRVVALLFIFTSYSVVNIPTASSTATNTVINGMLAGSANTLISTSNTASIAMTQIFGDVAVVFAVIILGLSLMDVVLMLGRIKVKK